jgi:hypothetical protein
VSDRGSLLERLTGGETGPDEDPRVAQFVRGLAIGALVGAAIAGSTLLQRRRAAERAATASSSLSTPGEPDDARVVAGEGATSGDP